MDFAQASWPAQELWRDPLRGSVTLRHDLTLDRGLSYEAALLCLQEHERMARAPPAHMTADPQ